MAAEVLVHVEGVSKKFCRDLKRSLWYGVQDIGYELLGCKPTAFLREQEFWALNDIDFELRRGECLGLIGHNGAGKSTLLKLLNGLIKPDKGQIRIKGRVSALIELGTGFNPILTGRENIYNNGAILGFTSKEIDQKFDAIVAFSEVEEFLDTPVQNYSSGMKVKLGFAVASQMNPDVLLIDEVLAVGDAGFRAKCYNEIYRIMETAAVILVSHSMTQVGKVCTRGILLHQGAIGLQSASIAETIGAYYNIFPQGALSFEGNQKARLIAFAFGNSDKLIHITNVTDANYQPQEINIAIDHPVDIILSLEVNERVDLFNALLFVSDIEQKNVAQTGLPPQPFTNTGKRMNIRLHFPALLLNTGSYALSLRVFGTSAADRGEIILGIRNMVYFSIQRNTFIGGAPIIFDNTWEIQPS